MFKQIVTIAILLSIVFPIYSIEKVTDNINNEKVYLYLDVDELPAFKNHQMTITKYINENFIWKEMFHDWSYIPVFSFIITKSGDLISPKTEVGMCPEIENDIIEVLKKSSEWNPGKIDGKPVNVKLIIPYPLRFSNK